nr:glycosyltransferase [Candidatus Levybacteria bacterium]
MNKSFEVSIIIVNYNVERKVLNCIKSLVNSKSKINFEIIIIDNSEFNNLEKFIKKFSNVRYFKALKNLGFGGGNNLGAKYAKGEYLFFLNPDTLIVDDAIEKLYKLIKSDNKIGIVSPLLVDKNLQPFSTQSRKELTPINAIFSFSLLRKLFPQKNIYSDPFFENWDYKKPIEVDTVPGAALMISKKLFDKVNGFDERFFLYFEENDLSKRIKELGFKLYINPNAKVIHEVGQSIKQIKTRDSYFEKSRFLYLKKHYGLVKALFTESILRINKTSVVLSFILLSAFFLRIVNLSVSMPFIGDQGWFYLSARDMLIEGKIPLVGITSSHTWLHQGPLWTYMLSVALLLGKFNPLSGGILTAIFGLGSTYLMYKLGSRLFSQRTGLIAASLYAVSPLIVFFERIPFDPSVIPFFTILYFYAVFKWVTGNIKFFPLILFLIAILYNLELATFTLFFPFILILIYGFVKRKNFVIKLLNFKTFIYSLISLLIPMIPILIYDFSNGFKQTVIFLGWIIYKPFSFLINHSSGNLTSNVNIIVSFILVNIQKLIFQTNLLLAVIIFLSSVALLMHLVFEEKSDKITNSKFLLLFLLIISFAGILLNQ